MWRYTLTLNTPVTHLILVVAAVCFRVTEGGVLINECEQLGSKNSTPTSENRISLTCEGLQGNETAQWVLRGNATRILVSLLCNPSGKECNTTNPDIRVSRPTTSSTVLTILNNYQMWLGNGNVSCSSVQNVSNFYTCNASAVVPSTSSTPRQQSTSTQVAPSTSSTARRQPSSTQVGTTTQGLQNEENGDGLPIAAIAGGAAAFLVIVIIIIVVVVVVRRWKSQKKALADNNVLEEHVNPMYGSGDEPDTTSPLASKPSGIALRIPTDTSNNDNNAATLADADNAFDAGYSSMAFGEQQTASPSSVTSPDRATSQNTATQPGFATNTATPVVVTDADLYTAVGDLEQEQTSGPVQDHAGGYSTVGGPNNSATAAPSGDVYAVVPKSGPRAQSTSATTTVSPTYPGDSADGAYAFVDVLRSSAPASSASKTTSGGPVSDNADNTYAVVNKSSSRGKGTGASNPPDTSTSTQQAQSGDVYAQVDKSSKLNVSTPENDDEGQSYVYAQVDKTSKENNSTPV